MSNIKVAVTIRALQTLDGEKETMTQRAQGTLRREGETWLLTYREGEASGLGDTQTSLEVGPAQAVLTRTGEVVSRMVFRPGQSQTSFYQTPYGRIPMTLRTLSLRSDLGERGGHVTIHYTMEIGGAAGETRLRLTVKTKENEP